MTEPIGKRVGLAGVVMVAVCASLVLLARGPAVSAQTPSAQDTYLDKCASCHGADGAGKTAQGRKMKVKDVHDAVKTMTEAQMIAIVRDGKAPNMDAYGKVFSADQIQALVAYYRGLAK